MAGANVSAAQGIQDALAATFAVEEPHPEPTPAPARLSDPNGRTGEALNEPGERSGLP